MDHDILMTDVDDTATRNQDVTHFVIAVDFGTTFSSVCFACYSQSTSRSNIALEHIDVINNYPDSPYSNIPPQEVPTELWYIGSKADITGGPAQFDRHLFNDDDTTPDQSEDEPSIFQSFIQGAASPSRGKTQEVLRGSNRYRKRGRGRGGGRNSSRARGGISLMSRMTDPGAGHIKWTPPQALRSDLVHWGYSAQQHIQDDYPEDDIQRHLTKFKLMLSDRKEAAPVKEQVIDCCEALRKLGLIQENEDVITDYLLQLFQNTRRFLLEFEGYSERSKIEYVMCVPAVWTRHACQIMDQAMATAVVQSGLGKLDEGVFEDLFIVSEPEAAAACVLAETNSRVKFGEVFVLIDAGGGTVDTITYEVTQNEPLRMKCELVEPDGALCGSSYINLRFEKMLKDKLLNAEVIEGYAQTKTQIISSLVVKFEQKIKSQMDRYMTENKKDPFRIKILELRFNDTEYTAQESCIFVQFSRKEYESLFLPSLVSVADLMNKQIKGARRKKKEVKKVVLIGGFGQSQSLAAYLTASLRQHDTPKHQPIELIKATRPGTSASAVARGAVLRALCKEHGPQRELQSSYGFIRHEPYDCQNNPAHKKQEPITWDIDGKQYIENTIDWMLIKGTIQKPEDTFKRTIEVTFKLDEEDFEVNEEIWVSDSKHKSHYRSNHPFNKGAEKLGHMNFNLARVKTEQQFREYKDNPPHWRITFILVLIVNGRSLCYEVRWPDECETLINRKRVSLASAFLPGTA